MGKVRCGIHGCLCCWGCDACPICEGRKWSLTKGDYCPSCVEKLKATGRVWCEYCQNYCKRQHTKETYWQDHKVIVSDGKTIKEYPNFKKALEVTI